MKPLRKTIAMVGLSLLISAGISWPTANASELGTECKFGILCTKYYNSPTSNYFIVILRDWWQDPDAKEIPQGENPFPNHPPEYGTLNRGEKSPEGQDWDAFRIPATCTGWINGGAALRAKNPHNDLWIHKGDTRPGAYWHVRVVC
jgi:hypothetical protein